MEILYLLARPLTYITLLGVGSIISPVPGGIRVNSSADGKVNHYSGHNLLLPSLLPPISLFNAVGSLEITFLYLIFRNSLEVVLDYFTLKRNYHKPLLHASSPSIISLLHLMRICLQFYQMDRDCFIHLSLCLQSWHMVNTSFVVKTCPTNFRLSVQM